MNAVATRDVEYWKTKAWEKKVPLGIGLLIMISLAFCHPQPWIGFALEIFGIALICLPTLLLTPLQKKTSKGVSAFMSVLIVFACAMVLWYPDSRGMIESDEIKGLVLVFGMGALLYLTRLT